MITLEWSRINETTVVGTSYGCAGFSNRDRDLHSVCESFLGVSGEFSLTDCKRVIVGEQNFDRVFGARAISL